MLAAHVLGMKYVGIDANKKLIEELTQMAKDLQIDAELYHGDSSDAVLVERAMRGRKAEVVFTSPPYFDKEHYSEDKEQSIIMFPERDEWERKFCKAMVSNAVSVLAPASVIILNIDTDLNMCNLYSQGWNIKEIDVLMENSRTQHVERLVFISTGVLGDLVDESNLYVVCRQCGRKCQKLSEHIRKAHRMSKEEYLLKYPEMPMVSQKMSDLISASSPTEKGGYTKHIAYRCPDGKVVGKKDAWERAWGTDTPPIDSIVDGSLFDPWAGKIAGIDYVICTVCGYKSANLSRHIKREHSGVEYIGEAKSKRCIENLSLAAQKSWDIRGRTEPRDSSLNKTHKKHGLTKEMLEQLYVVAGLSDTKIGERYGMSGEGISYQRKKFGIATRSRREKCFADYSE